MICTYAKTIILKVRTFDLYWFHVYNRYDHFFKTKNVIVSFFYVKIVNFEALFIVNSVIENYLILVILTIFHFE